MTEEDKEDLQQADSCRICGKKYTKEEMNDKTDDKTINKRVRDHCHITGKYRGSAHRDCNINFSLTTKIPVIFHNLRGYDSHFIMQPISQVVKDTTWVDEDGLLHKHEINAIAHNFENYMAFMLVHNLTFIDSFQFLSLSLDKLVKNLIKESLKYTGQEFRGQQFDLMARKGVYPYDYMDSLEKFN